MSLLQRIATSAPLMESVSGVRGIAGKSITPEKVVRYIASFITIQRKERAIPSDIPLKIIVGRDSRISGPWIELQVVASLQSLFCKAIRVGIVPTPTVQYLVEKERADGGIIITSSHNPEEWNGLKFVEATGLFISPQKCLQLYSKAKEEDYEYPDYRRLGSMVDSVDLPFSHVCAILSLPFIQPEVIKSRNLRIVLDSINGAGGPLLVDLLNKLGVKEVIPLNQEPSGVFSHAPEPLPQNLNQLKEAVKANNADLGIAVDPDADRCVLIDENGEALGEEYTLALAVDFMLGKHVGRRGKVCKNLSTSRAVDDIAARYGCETIAAPVGEIHVADCMVQNTAVIGGEGNGGVMLPDIHIGRDSLVAAALIIQHLSLFVNEDGSAGTISQLKQTLPQYEIVKLKASLEGIDAEKLLQDLKLAWKDKKLNESDGIRMDDEGGWVHVRKSNTEPILRVIGEAAPQSGLSSLLYCQKALGEAANLPLTM